MPTFVLRLSGPRPNFALDLTDAEQEGRLHKPRTGGQPQWTDQPSPSFVIEPEMIRDTCI
jgi:hypothetical protein